MKTDIKKNKEKKLFRKKSKVNLRNAMKVHTRKEEKRADNCPSREEKRRIRAVSLQVLYEEIFCAGAG